MPDSIFTVIGNTTKNLVGTKLDQSGGVMTGPIVLPSNPTTAFQASTKGYVDTAINNIDLSPYALTSGASFTGDVNGTNLILSGDLTVNGAVTTLNTTNSTIKDSLILLSQGASGNQNAINDSGIMIERGSSEDNAAVFWDEGVESFRMATTTSPATANDLGGTSTAASLEVANLKTNGNDLGKVEEFFGGLLTTSADYPLILKTEFDAVATNGKVELVGTNSPFASTSISTSYTTPSEIKYELTEETNDGTNTTTSVNITECSLGGYTHLITTGTITIGASEITFS